MANPLYLKNVCHFLMSKAVIFHGNTPPFDVVRLHLGGDVEQREHVEARRDRLDRHRRVHVHAGLLVHHELGAEVEVDPRVDLPRVVAQVLHDRLQEHHFLKFCKLRFFSQSARVSRTLIPKGINTLKVLLLKELFALIYDRIPACTLFLLLFCGLPSSFLSCFVDKISTEGHQVS